MDPYISPCTIPIIQSHEQTNIYTYIYIYACIHMYIHLYMQYTYIPFVVQWMHLLPDSPLSNTKSFALTPSCEGGTP